MNKRVVAAIAGGVGLSVLVASAAALTCAVNPRVAFVDGTTSRPARIRCEPQLRRASEEVFASSVIMVPTVTIFGNVSLRRGAAEMQHADEPIIGPGVVSHGP